MPVVKVKTSNAPAGDGNDSLSTIVKQGIGKAPSLPMSADNPVQWIQLLHAFDNHADLPGWPLLSPVKLQMQKCEKCNRDFFAPINHRRHIRVHHRLKKLDKDSLKNRDLLRIFWDKLSVDEAKDIVALKNASVEDIPGGTVIKALTSAIRKPGYNPVPPLYIKSGSALLEIVQARSSRFPISSQEFFSILDDASEKTFLSGPAISMQKYLFDGEVGKIGLDARNLVAFTSFILEQKLVEAWLADKDAEALRCQKLLVEEEEAAQKRQAELLERKRRKKLRQKEQKAKEHRNEEAEVRNNFDPMEAEPPVEILEHVDASQLARQDPGGPSEMSLAEISRLPTSEEEDSKAQTGVGFVDNDSNTYENGEPQSNRLLGVPSWHAPPKPCAMSNGVYQIKSLSTSKPEFRPKHGIRDLRVAHTVNNKKVWSRKPKPEKDGEDLKLRVQEAFVQVGQDKKHELLIGSIAVNLGSSDIREKCDSADMPVDDSKLEYQTLKKVNNIKERNSNSDSIQGGVNQPTVKHWRRRQEVKDSTPVHTEAKVGSSALKDDNPAVNDESCFRSSTVNGDAAELGCTSSPTEGERPGSSPFSSEAVRTFLSQRWKEANASDHVKLVLSPEPDPPSPATINSPEVSEADGRGILGNGENRMATGPLKTKPEKGIKKRYIPKQRANGA